jgi:hypothetical protein
MEAARNVTSDYERSAGFQPASKKEAGRMPTLPSKSNMCTFVA